MGQEVEALHLPTRAASGCLALFSVAQSMSRVATGAVSEWAASFETNKCGIHKGIPRPAFLMVASAVGVAAHSILGSAASRTSFVVGTVILGMAFGMTWPLMVLIVGEVWGTRNHGANYMFFDGITSAVGTLLLSNFLSSFVYESQIESENEITCYGIGCFQMTHVIIAALCASGFVTSLGVLIQTRSVYGKPTNEVIHRSMTDELFGSPYIPKKTCKSEDNLAAAKV